MYDNRLFTSESVTDGHPDKIADQISDAILDAHLSQDENARVACETTVSKNFVLITGEITSNASVDHEQVAREKIKEIGYTDENIGFDYKNAEILLKINSQSPDINQGVDISEEKIGAGDQGIMFGYATNETDTYMPFAIEYANRLAKKLREVRVDGTLEYLRPDGKTQVTIEYDDKYRVKRIDSIVISVQHTEDVSEETLKEDVKREVISTVIDKELLDKDTKYYINPTGRFIIGGPNGDAGLTGRKIIVDTYGGRAAHGGGAFSGKDYTKVDRSAAYAARYIAKNIVASGVCKKIEIQLSYAIGVTHPLSVSIDTYTTNEVDEQEIINAINENFDLSPYGIIKMLDLKKPIYSQTSTFGHFGKDNLPWEKTDKVEIFKSLMK